jgi:hypothetical protein
MNTNARLLLAALCTPTHGEESISPAGFLNNLPDFSPVEGLQINWTGPSASGVVSGSVGPFSLILNSQGIYPATKPEVSVFHADMAEGMLYPLDDVATVDDALKTISAELTSILIHFVYRRYQSVVRLAEDVGALLLR